MLHEFHPIGKTIQLVKNSEVDYMAHASTVSIPRLASLQPFKAATLLESLCRAAGEVHDIRALISHNMRELEEDLMANFSSSAIVQSF